MWVYSQSVKYPHSKILHSLQTTQEKIDLPDSWIWRAKTHTTEKANPVVDCSKFYELSPVIQASFGENKLYISKIHQHTFIAV